jgi:hypothetical protein
VEESKRHISIKRIVILLFALLLIVAGLLAANTFSGVVEGKEIIAKGAVNVAANGQQCVIYQECQSGDYYVDINAKIGAVEVYLSSDNSTVNYSPNSTQCNRTPEFNGTSGRFIWGVVGSYSQPVTRYLVFLNPDGACKDVSYEISRHWTYTNYIYLTAGIAAAAAGFLLFALAVLQEKLRGFNIALKNQV